MSRTPVLPVVLLFFGLVGCATPPASVFVNGASRPAAAAPVALGTNAVGEECTEQAADGPSAEIFCGTWKEPSAHVRVGGAATADALEGLATGGAWRNGIDQRFVCDAPESTSILGGQPALQMQCTSRVGGWPYVALVAQANGKAWYADGVLSSVPMMYRTIGILSDVIKPDAATPSSAALSLLASRMAVTAVKSGDIAQFDDLINAATWSNRGDAQGSAEDGLRGALRLQETILPKNDPHTATTLMALALLVSDQGRFAEATALFARAAVLAPQSPDPNAQAILLYYRGLDAKNRGNLQEALDLLTQADAAYVQLVQQTSPDALRDTAGTGPRLLSLYGPGRSVSIASRDLAISPGSQASQSALLGLIEVRRNRGLVLRALGRLDESDSAVASATRLARSNGFNAGLTQDMVRADLYRASAMTASLNGQPTMALADLRASSVAFGRALPGSKSHADTDLLRAQELMRTGQPDAALPICQGAVKSLMALQAGTRPSLVAPCLDAYGDAIAAHPDQRQQLIAEMFIAAQLAQDDITRAQIAMTTARLQENIRDPKAGAAIREFQDARARLEDLYRRREALAAASAEGAAAAPAPAAQDTLDKQIAAALDTMKDKEQELQARSSNYDQLLGLVVSSGKVFAVLHPNEAFVAIVLGDKDGWAFALRDGKTEVQKIDGGLPRMADLVHRVRTSIAMTDDSVPRRPFDTAAAAEIYQAVLARFEPLLAGADNLIVAPSGPLLSLPFSLLLSGPPTEDLAQAPWLIKRMAVAHVPAPVNFVGLRTVAGKSAASRQWAGFGDPLPITEAQALESFPTDSCGATARRLAGLEHLAGTLDELEDVRKLMGAGRDVEKTGAAFTGPAVLTAPLNQFRILHFATHAILPTDIACLNEAAIVASPVPNAANAATALLTASQILGLKLDAEVAILSACNTGGPGGKTAGESLSGLARSFFFAGTRALLITHWLASDKVTRGIVAHTMEVYEQNKAAGLSAALADVQRALLAQATGDNAWLAHPAYWAVLALVGAGTTNAPSSVAGLSGVPASGL